MLSALDPELHLTGLLHRLGLIPHELWLPCWGHIACAFDNPTCGLVTSKKGDISKSGRSMMVSTVGRRLEDPRREISAREQGILH